MLIISSLAYRNTPNTLIHGALHNTPAAKCSRHNYSCYSFTNTYVQDVAFMQIFQILSLIL